MAKYHKDELIIRDKAYIPIHLVDEKKVHRYYATSRYEEASCAKCEYLHERHNYLCDTCAAFLGNIVLYSKKKINGKHYIGLPIGDKTNFRRKAGLPSWIYDKVSDERPCEKHGYKIRFTGKRRDYQKSATNEIIEAGYGQLKAPPRSGKTVMLVWLTLKIGTTTLIMAHQDDLLKQILGSFYEFTNIRDVEFEHKKKLVGIAHSREDILKWPIVLTTYQKFISMKGKKFLYSVRKQFGAVMIDEVHKASAFCFSQVAGMLWAKVKIGFTATPQRKDKLEIVTESIIGPVTASVDPPQVKPRVVLHLTGVKPTRPYKIWHYAMAFLAKNKKRHQMIVDQAVADVKAGHHIVIPVAYVHQAKQLAEDIDKILHKKYGKGGMAVAFHSKVKNRDEILDNCRSGRIKVVVGIRQLIQAGINVPRWSAIYEIAPIANVPNHTQEIARVRTPLDGKPQPLIRHFVDEYMGMCIGCFKICFKVYKDFEWDAKSREQAYTLLKMRKEVAHAMEDIEDEQYKPVSVSGSGFGTVKTHTRSGLHKL
jgi:superfamily II DNA or RNA helicase